MFIPAPVIKRIIEGLIDYVVLMLLAIVIAIIFGTDWRYAVFLIFVSTDTNSFLGTIAIYPTIIFAVLYLGYFLLFETIARTSVGKTLIGLTIVKEDGTPIGFREALIRTLLRGTDGAPFWYILGLIAILLSPTRQRIGDHLAQAIVVEKTTVEPNIPKPSVP